jgi:hypothetical protein
LILGAVYGYVVMVIRFRVLEGLFGGCEKDCRIDREKLDSGNIRAFTLLKIY